jgi:hypothetical protein
MLTAAGGLLVRLTVGGLLILAGGIKLSDSQAQRRKWLQAYELLPERMVPSMAVGIPVAELTVGVSVAAGAFGWLAGVAAAGLLAAISGAAAATLIRGRSPRCGCFGRLTRESISWRVVVRNLIMASAVLGVELLGLTRLSIGTYVPVLGQSVTLILVVGLLSLASLSLRQRPTVPRMVDEEAVNVT